MVQWVVRSIPHSGPIELFLVRQCSTTVVTKGVIFYSGCVFAI